ncbi:hypothetical protein B0A52_01744 [Exophiala mesophila]|uniref:Uncharacterized protein n=1 Tax=Exophiala mesophila TaxID=212818 RepID=A0A438NFW5_EXOME|nr:hypothetical protein B0A52_01744 [Exophiala mesophila]
MANPSIFTPKFSDELSQHLSRIPSIQINSLSRLTPDRLRQTAFPHIGSIELVHPDDFMAIYNQLYVDMFPKRPERESSALIAERLAAQACGIRDGLAPYHIVGIRDHAGNAIGAAHFSVLCLPPDVNGNSFAVPYLQYIYVRPENRRQDISEVLHTMVLAVTSADVGIEGRTVPFTLFETEPPGYGEDEKSKAVSLQRTKIHALAGGVALVLRRHSDGKVLSAHVQPGLEGDDQPLTLTWAIRESPNQNQGPGPDYDVASLGTHLVAAYYQSLRDEGFPLDNIRLAESILRERCVESTFETMALGDVVAHVN